MENNNPEPNQDIANEEYISNGTKILILSTTSVAWFPYQLVVEPIRETVRSITIPWSYGAKARSIRNAICSPLYWAFNVVAQAVVGTYLIVDNVKESEYKSYSDCAKKCFERPEPVVPDWD
jgi:hypothetical protein